MPREGYAGREELLAAAERLLRTMPAARVSFNKVALEAEVHPSLVRYHFESRSALMVAVVDRVTRHSFRQERASGQPTKALSRHIARSVQVVRDAPFLHHLIIDELLHDEAGGARADILKMHADLVDFYRDLWRADGGRELAEVDPLFLHLFILGASDSFASARPMIYDLMPPGTKADKLADEFRVFLIDLVLDGIRKREQAMPTPVMA